MSRRGGERRGPPTRSVRHDRDETRRPRRCVLWLGVTVYAVLGGADFGAGLWDLLAGDAERGERPRALIDASIGPVWEANHTWLIFDLVILWSAFPLAFASLMSTLFIPTHPGRLRDHPARRRLRLPRRTPGGWRAGARSGRRSPCASVITPFFLGTALGGDRLGPGPGRQRGGRSMDQLAQSDLAPRRGAGRRGRCVRRRGLPRGVSSSSRRPPASRRTSGAGHSRSGSSPAACRSWASWSSGWTHRTCMPA